MNDWPDWFGEAMAALVVMVVYLPLLLIFW